jgi:hypothetical protein
VRLNSSNGTYGIQLYLSANCSGAFPQGTYPVAESTGLVISNATPGVNGSVSTTIPISRIIGIDLDLVGAYITAVAWDEQNNTSEMSACERIVLGDNIFKSGFE